MQRKVKMEGILVGECECSLIGGIKCLLYGDVKYARALKKMIESYSPQSKEEEERKKMTANRLEYIIDLFEI